MASGNEELPSYEHGETPSYDSAANSAQPILNTSNTSNSPHGPNGPNGPNGFPDEKLTPSEPNASSRIIDWDFRFLEQSFSRDIVIFNSADAIDKYNLLKNAEPGSVQHDHALSLQQDGMALPLVRCTQHGLFDILSKKILTVYRYTPPPASEGRLFNPKTDRYVYCEVSHKKRRASYNVYEFKFTPDPSDASRDFTLLMIAHVRYPIADCSPYKGQRLRWVCDVPSYKFTKKWVYSLNKLGDDQVSLVDDMEEEYKVNKKNPILGNSWTNLLLPSNKKRSDFGAEKKVGQLGEVSRGGKVGFMYSEEVDRDLSVVATESIKYVGQDALVYLCLACFFKRDEDQKEIQRKSA